MLSGPIAISGVAGPVAVTSNAFSGRHAVTVGGQPAQRTGRRTFALPSIDGRTIEAKVSGSFTNPFPTVEIAGVKHRTGPAVPVVLQVLMMVPLVLVIGGLVGAAFGVGAVVVNTLTARSSQSTAVKALLMVGMGIGAVVGFLIIASAVSSAVN